MTTKKQKKTVTTIIVIFLERKKFDKLIVKEDISGLADKSNDFCNFLTIIWLYFTVYFPYYLPVKIYLSNDFISNKNFQHFPFFNSVRKHSKDFNKQL